MRRILAALCSLLATVVLAAQSAFAAAPPAAFAHEAFRHVWEHQDLPVTEHGDRVGRSWTWGPGPISSGLQEKLLEAEQHTRLVQYFDKARMEINNPNDDPTSEWYVSNGLLPVELMTGDIQIGFSQTEHKGPAKITAIGDKGQFPTYADLLPFYLGHGALDLNPMGRPVTQLLNPDGSIGSFTDKMSDPATFLVEHEVDHPVVKAFWDYQRQWGPINEISNVTNPVYGPVFDPLYVFGEPITDAFWVNVKVGAVERPILFQVFERRVMTYNPANSWPWQVEMGNVGRHYYEWRYGPIN